MTITERIATFKTVRDDAFDRGMTALAADYGWILISATNDLLRENVDGTIADPRRCVSPWRNP